MHILRHLAFGAVLFLAAVTPLNGQDKISYELVGYGGAVFSLADLADGFTQDIGGAPVTFASAHMEHGFVVGVAGGARFGAIQVEGMAAYWPSTQVVVLASALPDLQTGYGASSNVLIAGLSALYNFQLASTLIEPFLAGGVGIKKYDTDQPFAGALFVSSTDLMWNLGVGARFPISASTALRIEVRDYMSSFDFKKDGLTSKLQHDLVATVGLGVIFGGS